MTCAAMSSSGSPRHVPGFDMIEKLNIARDILNEEVCKVKFTKVDGSEREMVCTLRPDLLPQITEAKEPSNRKPDRTPALRTT